MADIFGTEATRETYQPGTSRIVLGLYEGQHAAGSRGEPDGPDYSVQDVAAQLGAGSIVNSAEVLSIRIAADGNTSYYSEELAEIVFPTTDKQRVYSLGDSMKQERFSVEDFDQQGRLSYMVETRWCQEPDPSQPIEK